MSTPRALVLGASRGIGRASARALAAAGWRLRLVARSEEPLAALVADLPAGPHRALAVDLTAPTGREALVNWLGDDLPDAVVQCLGGRSQPSARDRWEAALELNFHSVVALDELLLPRLLARGSGTIVHLSSSAAVHGRAFAPYAAAKAALNRYIVNRGRECLPRGVVLTGLMPAAVEGDNNDWAQSRTTDPARHARMEEGQILGRAQTTDEVAAVVAFLCSPAGRLFGGCVLPADPTLDH